MSTLHEDLTTLVAAKDASGKRTVHVDTIRDALARHPEPAASEAIFSVCEQPRVDLDGTTLACRGTCAPCRTAARGLEQRGEDEAGSEPVTDPSLNTTEVSSEPDSGDVEGLAEVLEEHREDGLHPDTCVCEVDIPEDLDHHYAAHLAAAILSSDWLASHDAKVRREVAERIADDCETAAGNLDLDQPNAYREGVRDGLRDAAYLARAEGER